MIKAFACIDSTGLHPSQLSVTLHPMKEPRDGQKRWKKNASGNFGTPAAPGRISGGTSTAGPLAALPPISWVSLQYFSQ